MNNQIKKIKMGSYDGIITNIQIPKEIKNGKVLNIFETEFIRIKIHIHKTNKDITITQISNERNSKLFKNDTVIVTQYGYLYDYPTFVKKLTQKLKVEYCDLSTEQYKNIVKKYMISEQQYQKHPQYLIDYEIN